MTKQEQRAETAALIRKARYGKRKLAITRLPCGERQSDSIIPRRRGGGMLPAHLNPLTMGGSDAGR